jgi:hypothetical protein
MYLSLGIKKDEKNADSEHQQIGDKEPVIVFEQGVSFHGMRFKPYKDRVLCFNAKRIR